jgi:universal stress protein A
MNAAQTNVVEEQVATNPRETAHLRFPFLLERILVLIDFSELSKKALRHAIPLAHCSGARLILLNVASNERHIDGPGLIASPEFETGKWRKLDERERQLVELCRQEIGREPKSEAIVQVGKPAHEIINAARTWNVDLIVMGTRGVTGVKRMLGSSTAQQVVAHAPCPVLVVQQDGHGLVPL